MLVSVFLPPGRDVIVIRARAEGENGELGDFYQEVRAGQSFLGWSYEELQSLGTAMHNIQPKVTSTGKEIPPQTAIRRDIPS